jgi:hypothetical protein
MFRFISGCFSLLQPHRVLVCMYVCVYIVDILRKGESHHVYVKYDRIYNVYI